jgi:hypothetical protein
MPFKSQSQRRFMYSQHPKIAKRWEKETPKKKLPEKKKGKMKNLPGMSMHPVVNCKESARRSSMDMRGKITGLAQPTGNKYF